MSLLREDMLIKSLKQVSLQRLRNLKMDMDKLARDSRIKSEESFWSLLEFHNIRLDERTRREFGHIIIDNRGVNVETALRHLKKAQRQTGRDSVEVLPKEPHTTTPDSKRLVPAATPTVPTFKPVLSTEKRNYKLDKFRSKARGLGKLSAALKDKNAKSVQPKTASNADEKRENENTTTLASPSQEASVKDKNEQESSNEKLKTVATSTSETTKPKPKISQASSSPKLLQILLREENPPAQTAERENNNAKETPDYTDNENKEESNELIKNQKSLLTNKSEENGKDQIKKNSVPKASISKETKQLPTNVGKEDNIPSTDQSVSLESTHDEKEEPADHTCVDNLDRNENTKSIHSDANEKDENSEDANQGFEINLDDTKHVTQKVKKNDETVPTTMQTDNSNDEPVENDLIQSSDSEDKPTTKLQSKVDDKAATPQQTEDDDESTTEEIKIDEPEEVLEINKTEKDNLADPEDSHKLPLDFEDSELTGLEGNLKVELTTDSSQADKSDEQSKIDEKDQNPTNITELTETNNKNKKQSTNNTDESKLIDKTENGSKQTPKEESTTYQDPEQSDPTVHESKNEPQLLDRADSHSITTLSSDNESESDEAYEKSSDLSKFSEHFQNWKAQNEVGLAVQWVYGCSTAYPQNMKINSNNELVYFSGCVVIVYNHVRKSQRHYLEHSGFITGIAVHPNEARIASAQLGTSKQANSTTDISSAVGFGQTHIRVWNCDTMETVTVIGIGIIRRPVYRLQFLDYQDYFVTIENDEACTLTLWEGGCRVTSVETVFQEVSLPTFVKPKPEVKRPKTSLMQKTGTNSPIRPRAETVVGSRNFSPSNNGPRCIGAIHTGEGKFITAGKRQINFWRLLDEYDNEYVQGESDGAQLSSPTIGHFGANFFKAEFLSCCCYTDRFTDGSMLTGDSNGTLLLWDESAKTPVRGFAHAHECHLSSICVSESGHIFTSGARDRLVKAFASRKSKFECCGKLKIPSEFGSATCIDVVKTTLFVATEKHVILAASLNFDQPAPVSKTKLLHKRSQSTQSIGKVAKVSATEESPSEKTTSSVIVCWEDQEVARGWKYRGKCMAALKPLKYKNRRLRGTESLDEYRSLLSAAISSTELKPSLRQLPKSAGVRRKFPDNLPTQAWKSRHEKYNQTAEDKLSFSNLHPQLHAHKRILSREKARNEDPSKYDETYMHQNFVRGHDLFYSDGEKKQRVTEFFVSVSNDGWIHIYSAGEQTIIGRCKVPELDGVTCVDTSARRQFVAIGNLAGKLTLARINKTAFELFPPLSFYCTSEGKSAINQLRFSPSGCKLLVSVGCDIAICHVTRSQVTEITRCTGHQSNTISGLDWTRKKHKDSYFIRSCGNQSKLELKVWNAKTTREASFIDDQDERHWASHTCVLNFNSKGQWTQFDDSSYTAHTVQISSWKSSKHSSTGLFCVGDVEGVITMGAYPCLDTTTTRTYRAHATSVTSVVGLSNKQQILTTADDDPSVVQWKICKA